LPIEERRRVDRRRQLKTEQAEHLTLKIENMKSIKILTSVALVALTLFPAAIRVIAVEEQPAFTAGASAIGSTISSVIISANGKDQGAPVINTINAASDLAGSVISNYVGNVSVVANYTNTTVSLPVNLTNGFAVGNAIIIRHVTDDTYERRIVTTFTSATNLTVTVAPTTAVIPGDLIYRADALSTIAWGASTNTVTGTCLVAGKKGKPILMDLAGTSVVVLRNVAGTFVK
jgi:hypothetical protein